jgi:hypothetical protein
MRPCHGCGAALQNNVVTCPDCGVSLKRPDRPPAIPQPQDREVIGDDDRWLWFNYLFFPVLFAIFAGVFGVINWGWIGALLGVPVGLVAFMIGVGVDLI